MDERDKKRYTLVEGEVISKPEITHGKGKEKKIEYGMLIRLMDNYRKGSASSEWIKAKGNGWVNMPDGEEDHDIHWYQHPKVGAVMIKIMRGEFDMYEIINEKGERHTIECSGVLNKSGILLESGDVIKEGRIVEFARDLQRLLHDRNYERFMETCVLSMRELSKEDDLLLQDTVISEDGFTVLWAMSYVADKLDGTDDDLMDSKI